MPSTPYQKPPAPRLARPRAPVIAAAFAAASATTALTLTAHPALTSAAESPVGEASTQPLVLVLTLDACCRDQAWPVATTRLIDELEIAGFRVVELPAESATNPTVGPSVIDSAQDLGAFAIVRLSRKAKGPGAEIWVAEPGGETNDATWQRRSALQTTTDELTALRTVEVVRAADRERRFAAGNENENDDDSESAPRASAAARHLWLSVSTGAQGSPGGTGVSALAPLEATYQAFEALLFSLDGTVTFLGPSLEHVGFAASFNVAFFRAFTDLSLSRSDSLDLAVGLGVGAALSIASGVPGESPATLRTETAVAAYLGARASLTLFPRETVGVRLTLAPGVLIPQPVVRFGSDEVAPYGAPVVEADVGLVFRLF